MAERVSVIERSHAGGIVALAELLERHRGAFEYEWRARFHLPVSVVGRSMMWGEFYRLVKILSADSGSQVAAAIAEWDHPFSQTDRLLADLFDLQHRSKARHKPAPYPRPWLAEGRRIGKTTMDPEMARALLRSVGPV